MAANDELSAGVFVEEGTLRVHIASLRRALREGLQGRNFIATVPGRGYSLVVPASRFGSDANATPSMAAASQLPAPLSRVVGRQDVIAALKANHIKSVAFSAKACAVAAQFKKQQAAGANGAPQAPALPTGPL